MARRRTSQRFVTPSEWHARRAKARKKHFRSHTDQDIERERAELAKSRVLQEYELSVAERKHAALLEAERLAVETQVRDLQTEMSLLHQRIEALSAERSRLSATHPRTGWTAYWCSPISASGLARQEEIDAEMRALREQLDDRSRQIAPPLPAHGHSHGQMRAPMAQQQVAIKREIDRLNKLITWHSDELAAREATRSTARRADSRRAAAEKEQQGQLVFDGERAKSPAIITMLSRDHECPYCGGHLGELPHADHIYPVVLGGLSRVANMVYVCAACNLRKKDMTLSEFIEATGLERDVVEQRLKKLGKQF